MQDVGIRYNLSSYTIQYTDLLYDIDILYLGSLLLINYY